MIKIDRYFKEIAILFEYVFNFAKSAFLITAENDEYETSYLISLMHNFVYGYLR